MKRFVILATHLFVGSMVLGACDDADTEYVDREIEVPVDSRPVAVATIQGEPFETGKELVLDGSQSTDDDEVVSWTWDVDLSDGIGMDGTGETFAVTYDEPGDYTVTLTVADADGNTDSTSLFVRVSEAPDREAPVAVVGENRQVALYSMVEFDGSASTDNVGIVSYSWDFDTADGIGEDAAGPVVQTSYAVEEVFTVRLTVADAAGNESFAEFQVTVGADEQPPQVEIPEAYEGAARTFFGFDASGATDNVGIASFAWDVDGDGTTDGDNAELRYSFEEPGQYNGSLVVSDFSGNATTVDFVVTVSAAVPQSLYARPDRVSLQEPGAATTITIRLRYPDGSTEPATDANANSDTSAIAVSAGSSANSFALTADDFGTGTIVFEAAGLSTEVPARVGGDVVVVTGLEHPNYPAERYFDVATQAAKSREITGWTSGLTPVDAVASAGRGYILNSGEPGRENASLLVVDTDTLEEIAFCDLGAAGAYAVAARTPSEVYVAGVGHAADVVDPATDSAVVKIDPATCTVEPVFVPEGTEATNGMKRGADLDIVDELLIITDSGLTPSYAYERPSLRFFDMSTGAQRKVIGLPDGCLNAGWSTVAGSRLITGCTGDYASPGAVVVTSLVTETVEQTIELGAGSPASWAYEPFSGYLFMGSGMSPYVGVVDVFAGRVLREIDDGIFLDVAPDDEIFASMEFVLGLHVLNPETVVAASFLLDHIYAFDPIASPGLEVVEAFARVTPDPGGRGAQLLMDQGIHRAPITLTEENARVTAVSADGEAAIGDAIRGAPAGGGNFSPNADLSLMATVPDAGFIEIQLQGVELVDGPGADFVVYENPFYTAGNFFSRAIDPARIQLSPDGMTWYDYPVVEDASYPIGPFTSDVRRFVSGFVGTRAVYANPAKNDIGVGSEAAGGDRFDLAEVGLSSVRAIRIVDVPNDGKTANIDAVALVRWRHN